MSVFRPRNYTMRVLVNIPMGRLIRVHTNDGKSVKGRLVYRGTRSFGIAAAHTDLTRIHYDDVDRIEVL